jgi:hypothetical protein
MDLLELCGGSNQLSAPIDKLGFSMGCGRRETTVDAYDMRVEVQVAHELDTF